MDISDQFKKEIAPFFWVDLGENASVCLYIGEYLQEVFNSRATDGFVGSGYDWRSLAEVFLEEKCPDLYENISFDPEYSMFCAYSSDKSALSDFIHKFKNACEDKLLILDLFSRAKLD